MILGILLAAGAARRMGRDKLILPWGDSTVLATTLERWLAVPELDRILLVRRPDSPVIDASRVQTLVNPNADEGMGSSLRIAAQSLPLNTKAVAIGLADMPEVASQTISSVVKRWQSLGPAGIVAPTFQGVRGHPVVLGAAYFSALGKLKGDQGARAIVREHTAHLRLVAVDDPGVLMDLDTPADLEQRP